jgi:hypothetical protein
MPLAEVAEYIEQQGRLPNIPSAEEVKRQGGHNMTELQLKLLEKVEEMTLYAVEHEQKIKNLELLLRDLQDELESIPGSIEKEGKRY